MSAESAALRTNPRAERFGSYVLYEPIARGGMATVHTARLVGAEGFSRLVAAKRLHPQYAEDPEFVTMLHDEARIASKIHHPNVVPVLDVVMEGQEVILVQEYVHGVPLAALMRAAQATSTPFPPGVVAAVVTGVLAGLHAAHEAHDELGAHLGIVHRDVSPQNVMVTVDGVPRLLDFGIAKAQNRAQHTRQGFMKGKMGYMAPEQLRMEAVTRRVDLYATGVLLWELLANRRMYSRENERTFLTGVLSGNLPTLTATLGDLANLPAYRRDAIHALEPIVLRAMALAPENRFDDAAAMLQAISRACPGAASLDVARWVRRMATDDLDRRDKMLAANEESWRSSSKMTTGISSVVSGVQTGLFATDAVATTGHVRGSLPPPAKSAGAWPLARIVPWAVCAGLALAVAGLAGSLLGGRTQPPASATAATSDLRAAAPLPAPTAPARARLDDDEPDAAKAAPPRNTQGAAPVYTPRAARPAPPQAAPRTQTPAASTSAPTDPTAVDCNPPFYFAGSRKVFKPSCL